MRILVPVKQVASLDEDFALDDSSGRVPEDELDWQLNEWDTFSLEAALQLTEDGMGEVVTVSVGDEEAQDGLLSCLAKGADRAIRVWDEDLAQLDLLGAGLDTLVVANVLAAVARRESPDLILCGVQSSDSAGAATGVALAGLLGLTHVAVVNAIERDGDGLTVQRELEGGTVERLRLEPPALLTVQTGINEPRYATLRAIKQAREKPSDLVSLAELELSADQLGANAGAIAARIAEIVKEAMG